MAKLSRTGWTALCLSLASGVASADVRYEFTSTSAIPFEGVIYTGSFSFVAPDFIVSDTDIPVTSMAQCTATTSSGAVPCSYSSFMFNVSQGYDTVGFGVQASESSPNLRIYYYFTDGAFSTPGQHASQIFGADQAGTLTVSLLSAVPELSSWAYAALGLAGMLAMVRRPKAVQPI